MSVIRKLADTLREQDGLVTLTIAADDCRTRVIDIISGEKAPMNLGIAVDLGTTTISVQLIDLENAKVVSTQKRVQ